MIRNWSLLFQWAWKKIELKNISFFTVDNDITFLNIKPHDHQQNTCITGRNKNNLGQGLRLKSARGQRSSPSKRAGTSRIGLPTLHPWVRGNEIVPLLHATGTTFVENVCCPLKRDCKSRY